jgi:hypothetical protein
MLIREDAHIVHHWCLGHITAASYRTAFGTFPESSFTASASVPGALKSLASCCASEGVKFRLEI